MIRPTSIMSKPTGAVCNLSCTYCYYLEKHELYPGLNRKRFMSDEVLEALIKQTIAATATPTVDFIWQGGEPTLMGLPFFERALALQKKHSDGRPISNALQTNGSLLDDAWGDFLARNEILVGLSLDGPEALHFAWRGGFREARRGLDVLRRHGVVFNLLASVHHETAQQPAAVYDALRDCGARMIQFVPILERRDGVVSEWSVRPGEYGAFLNAVFDRWRRRDVGRVFLRQIESVLGAWLGGSQSECVFAETCGNALVVEHNGDLFACDHYVYDSHRLGNLLDDSLLALASQPFQQAFGTDKRDSLCDACRSCSYRFACHGDCPKHRIVDTDSGAISYLCGDYLAFFAHLDPWLRFLAHQVRRGLPTEAIMDYTSADQLPHRVMAREPCRCGSGKKFRRCCGPRG